MKVIKQSYLIKAPIEKVWQALTDPQIIEKWGGGPAEMSDEEGADFKLWGGDIYGKNIKVIKEKELVQEWYGGKWDKPSLATFKLSSEGDGIKVELINKDVPDDEVDDIADGWKRYYLGPLKQLLEKV